MCQKKDIPGMSRKQPGSCAGNRAAVTNECGLHGLFLLFSELSNFLFSFHE